MAMRKEILSGKRVAKHERFYKQYFQIKETPIRGLQVTVIDEAVKATKRYYGYFTLISNEKMDAMTALELYRNKEEYIGKTVKVAGWIRTSRASKNFGFVELNDGSFFKNMQIVLSDEKLENFIRNLST